MITILSPKDSEVFRACLNEVLCPGRSAGQVVVDNLAAHKIAGFAEAIPFAPARVFN